MIIWKLHTKLTTELSELLTKTAFLFWSHLTTDKTLLLAMLSCWQVGIMQLTNPPTSTDAPSFMHLKIFRFAKLCEFFCGAKSLALYGWTPKFPELGQTFWTCTKTQNLGQNLGEWKGVCPYLICSKQNWATSPHVHKFDSRSWGLGKETRAGTNEEYEIPPCLWDKHILKCIHCVALHWQLKWSVIVCFSVVFTGRAVYKLYNLLIAFIDALGRMEMMITTGSPMMTVAFMSCVYK